MKSSIRRKTAESICLGCFENGEVGEEYDNIKTRIFGTSPAICVHVR